MEMCHTISPPFMINLDMQANRPWPTQYDLNINAVNIDIRKHKKSKQFSPLENALAWLLIFPEADVGPH